MDNEETAGLGLGLNALFDEDDNVSAAKEADLEQETEDAPEITEDLATEIFEMEDKLQNDDTDTDTDTRKRYNVGVEQLYPSRFQPRRLFDDNSIDDLASSIKQYGVLQPLLVRADPDNTGHYEIVAGERRWRAAQRAKIHNVPVVVLDIDEIEAFKIALIENLQREDLDPIDEALGYQKLLKEYDQTQEGLAKAVGKSRSHITNMVRLLGLPDMVQAYLSVGDLSMGHARALITSEDANALAKQVISKGLSVRQTEKLAMSHKKLTQKVQSGGFPASKSSSKLSEYKKDADTIALETDMSNALGMNVSIDSNDGHCGKLSIEFKSLDQLDELLHRLAHFPGSRLNG